MAAVLIIAMAVLPIAGMPRAWILYGLLFLIYLTMSNMWNLVAGYSGLISLAQPAFLGIAGYTLAIGNTARKTVNTAAKIFPGLIIACKFFIYRPKRPFGRKAKNINTVK